MLRAMMGQLEMPRPLVNEYLMHQADLEKAFERAVDGHFIEMPFARAMGDLVVAERRGCFEQYLQYRHAPGGAIKLRPFEHPAGLGVQIRLFHIVPRKITPQLEPPAQWWWQ